LKPYISEQTALIPSLECSVHLACQCCTCRVP